MNSKDVGHSKGPWHLFDHAPAIRAGNASAGADGTRYRISAEDTLWVDLVGASDGFVYGRNYFNARLIRAAPELLDILIELNQAYNQVLNDLESDNLVRVPSLELSDRVDAIIADAQGKPTAEEMLEQTAKEIYATWASLPGYVPWVDHGNSLKQDQARVQARAILEVKP